MEMRWPGPHFQIFQSFRKIRYRLAMEMRLPGSHLLYLTRPLLSISTQFLLSLPGCNLFPPSSLGLLCSELCRRVKEEDMMHIQSGGMVMQLGQQHHLLLSQEDCHRHRTNLQCLATSLVLWHQHSKPPTWDSVHMLHQGKRTNSIKRRCTGRRSRFARRSFARRNSFTRRNSVTRRSSVARRHTVARRIQSVKRAMHLTVSGDAGSIRS